MNPEGKNLVLSLCFIGFMTMSSFSIMAPFFPIKAKEVGLSIMLTGEIMSAMAMLSMFSGFLTGKVMHRKTSTNNQKARIILSAILLLIMQNVALGYLEYVESV